MSSSNYEETNELGRLAAVSSSSSSLSPPSRQRRRRKTSKMSCTTTTIKTLLLILVVVTVTISTMTTTFMVLQIHNDDDHTAGDPSHDDVISLPFVWKSKDNKSNDHKHNYFQQQQQQQNEQTRHLTLQQPHHQQQQHVHSLHIDTSKKGNTTILTNTVNNVINNNNNNTMMEEFEHHDGGVIVTKIHGPHQLPLLEQSLCLLHHAYNHRVLYDIVVFVTIPLTTTTKVSSTGDDNKDDDTTTTTATIDRLRSIVAPANLQIVVDNNGIVHEIEKLSSTRRDKFLRRCSNVTQPQDVTWDTECEEEGVKMTKLSYNWQAEFRSWHIWTHPALTPYKYMMWIDSDAFCTRPWDRDPMAVAMNNELAILFANYPQGRAKVAQPRVHEVFGKYICRSRKTNEGHLETTVSDVDCGTSQLWTIHGFMHVTSLDFYRQDIVQQWAKTLIGDCFLCRQFDDQTMVTVPAAILAPDVSWDMYRNGIRLDVAHNNLLDGKRKKKVGGFLNYWKSNAKESFPVAWDQCTVTAGN